MKFVHNMRGRRGLDHMVVGFTTTYAISALMLWVRIAIRARCTTFCNTVCRWLASGWCFFPGPPVSSTNKTDRHDIAEILLKVALNTIKQTNKTSRQDVAEILLNLVLIINQSFKICSIKIAWLIKAKVRTAYVDFSFYKRLCIFFCPCSTFLMFTVPVNKSMKIPKSLSQLSHPLSLLMFEWVDMSIRGVMFQCDNTIKI